MYVPRLLGVVPLSIGMVFLGCCSNVVFLELIIKEDPSSGNIITFFQFLFISLESGIFVTRFGLRPSPIPMRRYIVLVSLFFIVSVLNNYAFSFNISLALHMIFRAGSLIANMLLGVIVLKKIYPVSKYIGVVLITVGIIVATLSSAQQVHKAKEETTGGGDVLLHYAKLAIGLVLLVTALVVAASMGIYQELLTSDYGKHPRESMFYMHALTLPGFLLVAPDIWSKALSFSASEPISLGLVHIPKLWLYIIGNSITQYICIRGVFTLTTECPSLIVNLIITLRKFVSLLFSIFYFQNPFTGYHWIATGMVFGGTALFMGVFHSLLSLGWSGEEGKKEAEKEKKKLVMVENEKKQD